MDIIGVLYVLIGTVNVYLYRYVYYMGTPHIHIYMCWYYRNTVAMYPIGIYYVHCNAVYKLKNKYLISIIRMHCIIIYIYIYVSTGTIIEILYV